MSNLTVGIIGGRGQLGGWCAGLFQRRGATVLLADFGSELTNREIAERADIVVVSVPIGVTDTVLGEISEYLKPRQLLVDFTSVKTPFIAKMEGTESEVLSVHPMFNPHLSATKDQTCIVCPVRPGDRARVFEEILREEGLRLVSMPPEAHDRMMAIVQGLTHFQAITAAHCMAALHFEPAETLQSASPVYRLRLAMIGRILAQNPRLYAEIQIYNPFVREVLEQLRRSNERLMSLVIAKDVDGLVAEFSRVRDELGAFSRESLQEFSKESS